MRFRWPVIAAWIAVAVVLHLAAASAGEDWTDNLTLPGTGSTQATDLLQERLPQQAYGSIPIALRDPNGTIGDSASKAAIDSTVKNLNAVPHVIRVVSPLDPGASALLSKDGKIAYISVTLDIGSGDTSVGRGPGGPRRRRSGEGGRAWTSPSAATSARSSRSPRRSRARRSGLRPPW